MSFFEAGGNSLMLLRLHAELDQRGVAGLTVTDLFRFPTVATLAERVSAIKDRPGADGQGADGQGADRRPGPALVRRGRLQHMEGGNV
jgi:hypothetical protein